MHLPTLLPTTGPESHVLHPVLRRAAVVRSFRASLQFDSVVADANLPLEGSLRLGVDILRCCFGQLAIIPTFYDVFCLVRRVDGVQLPQTIQANPMRPFPTSDPTLGVYLRVVAVDIDLVDRLLPWLEVSSV